RGLLPGLRPRWARHGLCWHRTASRRHHRNRLARAAAISNLRRNRERNSSPGQFRDELENERQNHPHAAAPQDQNLRACEPAFCSRIARSLFECDAKEFLLRAYRRGKTRRRDALPLLCLSTERGGLSPATLLTIQHG